MTMPRSRPTGRAAPTPTPRPDVVGKAPSGIRGLDDITGGGLPRGRATLVCGPAGSGKTLLGVEFLVRGILDHGEPGVLVTFEESADDVGRNVASLGFDLAALEAAGHLVVDHVSLDGIDAPISGDWDLDALLLRIGAAIDAVGARRIVIDTIEVLFDVLDDGTVLRSELRRLFRWLKERGVTALITGEQGSGPLTRHGIEEYVSDCVIVLDNRVTDQTTTRRLRVLKYRGSLHGTNEYPFLIGDHGISVLPITSLARSLQHRASDQRISTGIATLDAMLGGGGFYTASTIAVSGPAGTGKSTVAAHFCDAACRRGERALFVSFEESEAEIVRNMRSVGIRLDRWVEAGLLRFRCFRPSLLGLEEHLHAIQTAVDDFAPAVVVKDPISDLLRIGSRSDVLAMLTRQVDFLKGRGVTTVFTSVGSETAPSSLPLPVDALVDSWVLLDTTERGGRRERLLHILKSRGMAHTTEVRAYRITEDGIVVAAEAHDQEQP